VMLSLANGVGVATFGPGGWDVGGGAWVMAWIIIRGIDVPPSKYRVPVLPT